MSFRDRSPFFFYRAANCLWRTHSCVPRRHSVDAPPAVLHYGADHRFLRFALPVFAIAIAASAFAQTDWPTFGHDACARTWHMNTGASEPAADALRDAEDRGKQYVVISVIAFALPNLE